MLPEPELARLVEDARDGDAAAFTRLVRATEGLVSSIVRRLVADPHEAEEVIQDVYVAAHRILPTWQPQAQFTTWLYRAATLASLEQRRTSARREQRVTTAVELQPEREPDDSSDPAATALRADLRDQVARAIESLPPRQRAVFVLRHFQDLPTPEIARVLEVAEGTVKSHLSQAVASLRQRLAELVEREPETPRPSVRRRPTR
jgi:RNA polymerase sigma-70 factor (ECF subfamily)